MTTYIFVHPATAPAGNVRLKAASPKKAIEQFQRRNPGASNFSVQGKGSSKEVFIFYNDGGM